MAAESFISRVPIADSSKRHYRSVHSKHVKPVFGDMTLFQVANDRDGVTDLLAVTMKHLSNTPRQQARHVIVGTVEEAVEAGKLSKHRLDGIELADNGRHSRKSFVRHRLAGSVAGVGGRHEAGTPKHRKAGEYRDVPAPAWLRKMVKDMPDGPLIPGNGKLFQRYGTIYFRFMRAAEVADIAEGFTPHSLRHAYASAMLARGVQITELAHFLGHRDINVTHQLYGHPLPSAAKRAVAALDAEFAEWSKG